MDWVASVNGANTAAWQAMLLEYPALPSTAAMSAFDDTQARACLSACRSILSDIKFLEQSLAWACDNPDAFVQPDLGAWRNWQAALQKCYKEVLGAARAIQARPGAAEYPTTTLAPVQVPRRTEEDSGGILIPVRPFHLTIPGGVILIKPR